MTLIRLLEIKKQMVRPDAEASLELAERIWAKHGSPESPDDLAEALEEVLTRCVERGMLYAPILLQRKKALERGTWKPRATDAMPPKAAEGVCAKCGGSGSYYMGGLGHLCPCGAWKNWGPPGSTGLHAAAGKPGTAVRPAPANGAGVELAKNDSAELDALESLGQIVVRAFSARGRPTGESK